VTGETHNTGSEIDRNDGVRSAIVWVRGCSSAARKSALR
jgi:hypothetical protein